MFRIAFLVEDKNLAKVLTSLAGLTLNMEPPQPVVNATVQKGKVKQVSAEGSITGRVAEAVAKHKFDTINRAEIGKLIVKNGGNVSGVGTMVAALKKTGQLTDNGERGVYTIKS